MPTRVDYSMVSVRGDGLVRVALSAVLKLFQGGIENLDSAGADRDEEQAINGRNDRERSHQCCFACRRIECLITANIDSPEADDDNVEEKAKCG